MIKVENVQLPYVNKTLNFTIPNTFNLLSGENGAGKTLFLDLVSGLVKPKSGKIYGNESIIYINQNIYFSDRLSGLDFLKFSYGINKSRDISVFYDFSDHIISRDYISELLNKQWGMLSGGERKFLYALILLSMDREWYILDEPFAFVDIEKKKLLHKLIDLKINQGKGIILTSHDEHERNLANNVNVLKI